MLLRERDGANGFEVYMARRSKRSKFMPEAYVFPGGTVDAADRSAGARARLLGPPETVEAPFAIAALRELFEEAGILMACRAGGDAANVAPELLAELRSELKDGAALAGVLERERLFLDARGLYHYSNWVTPSTEPLRFDTHFFVARAPRDQVAAADAFELYDGQWIEPRVALASSTRGEIRLMFPTVRHLERLGQFDSVDAAIEHARGRRIVSVEPFITGSGTIEIPAEALEW